MKSNCTLVLLTHERVDAEVVGVVSLVLRLLLCFTCDGGEVFPKKVEVVFFIFFVTACAFFFNEP